MTNNTEIIISIISLGFAFLAIVISIGGFLLNRRSVKLTENAADDKKPNLVPYLIDGFSINYKGYKIYAFYISISNRSDNGNTIAGLDLQILYNQDNHNTGNLLFCHDNTLSQGSNFPGHPPFSIPAEIGAHKTITGWGLYKITKRILEKKIIESYQIRIIDSHAIEVQLNPILIQEREVDEIQMA
jgi:hypothetical protein